MTHVPYKSGPAAMTDLIGGQVNMFTADFAVMLPQVKGGKIRGLAVTSTLRSKAIPELPTVNEALGLKDYELIAYFAVFAPAGTPPEIVKRLQEESLKALKSSAVTERFATDNAVGGGGPASEYAAFIKNEQRIWSDIVKRAGIKPD